MIITCNECNTSFNIDESLLKKPGLKVRCSKCKNVFLVETSLLHEKQANSGEIGTEPEGAVTDEKIESSEQHKVEEAATESQEIVLSDTDNLLETDEDFNSENESEESDFEFGIDLEEEAELELELEPDLEPEIDEAPAEAEAEIELELDDKDSSEISAEEELASTELPADEASEEDNEVEEKSEEPELELELELEQDLEPEIDEAPAESEIELEPDDKDSSEISVEEESESTELPADETSEEDTEPEEEPGKSELEIDEATAEAEAEEIQKEDIDKDIIPEEKASKAFNMGAMPDDQEAEKAIEPVDEAEKGTPTKESEQPKATAKTRISMPVLLLLLAALLISGAYGTYVLLDSTGIKIPFISNLLKPEVQDAGNLKIYASDINNKFVENLKSGKLLVITGKTKNGYSGARSYISITCKLYTKGKILSKTKTVYCGTVLSEPDLINMDLAAINQRLSNRFGDNKSNIKVNEGSIIPFMIVFSDLPENLDEFTIEVAGSFPS